MRVFVDTSALIALASRRDTNHGQALAIWSHLEEHQSELLTTDWVFGETVTFLRRRAGFETARKVGDSIRASSILEIVAGTPELVDRAWEVFLASGLPDLSFVDSLSFVVMRSLRISQVFTFDEHFVQAGFEVVRPPLSERG
jgi:predicted nucleic acid-binding protein